MCFSDLGALVSFFSLGAFDYSGKVFLKGTVEEKLFSKVYPVPFLVWKVCLSIGSGS